MTTTTQAFTGNAAIPYALDNIKRPYYADQAKYVVRAALSRLGVRRLTTALDLGAGIGVSAKQILKYADRVIAVEPAEGMRALCRMMHLGNPAVELYDGRGENLAEVVHERVEAVLCCQVLQLFHPCEERSAVPRVLEQISRVLHPGGVLAFDLGPSNFVFTLPISNHRSGTVAPGQIMTELSHPLYQRTEHLVRMLAQHRYGFAGDSLWPPVTARLHFDFLSQQCVRAGLSDLCVQEYLYPMDGNAMIHLLQSNAWTVFFRWPPLSDLSSDERLDLIEKALRQLFREPDFRQLTAVTAYHPAAVFTTIKAS